MIVTPGLSMDPAVVPRRVGVLLLRELSVDCCDRGVAWWDRGRAGLIVSDAMARARARARGGEVETQRSRGLLPETQLEMA